MENKRYLKIFSSQSDYDSQKDEVMGMPHVVLLDDTKKVTYVSKSEIPNDPFNGHEYVDLGLPSGTLWARNILTNADGEALYFQWGDVEGWTKEQVQNGEKTFAGDGSDYKWNEGEWSCDGSSMTKYNLTDGRTVLDLEDDAAHVHMGGDWHIPTKEQCEELTANTTSVWTTQNGVSGRLFISTMNGKSIFVPAFGYLSNGGRYNSGSGYVCSCSVNDTILSYVLCLYFDSSNVYIESDGRTDGNCVIGVVG